MQAVYDKLNKIVAGHVAKMLGVDAGNPTASPIIDIIIQLIPVLLPLILQCFNPPKAAAVANDPKFAERLRLRFFLAQHIPGMDPETVALRQHAFDAFLLAGKNVTEEDMTAVQNG